MDVKVTTGTGLSGTFVSSKTFRCLGWHSSLPSVPVRPRRGALIWARWDYRFQPPGGTIGLPSCLDTICCSCFASLPPLIPCVAHSTTRILEMSSSPPASRPSRSFCLDRDGNPNTCYSCQSAKKRRFAPHAFTKPVQQSSTAPHTYGQPMYSVPKHAARRRD